jgi:hypothetical protein
MSKYFLVVYITFCKLIFQYINHSNISNRILDWWNTEYQEIPSMAKACRHKLRLPKQQIHIATILLFHNIFASPSSIDGRL